MILFYLAGLLSCNSSPTNFATKWTNEIKGKIIADANQQYDRTTFDSTYYYLDKSSLNNNVLCNFGDSVYWGMFDGVKDETLKNKYAFDILNDLMYCNRSHNSYITYFHNFLISSSYV